MASPSPGSSIDGVLVLWGDRLFYPGNRIVKAAPPARVGAGTSLRAAAIRRRIEAAVAGRAPQVMVKVARGGRGMHAIAKQFNYITKNGELDFEDDRGVIRREGDALKDLVEQWRLGGSLIGETSSRVEAIYLTLSMPRGTDPQIVLRATREFARDELSDHRYVMVLHEHQENPHVHLCVRAESMGGERLRPWVRDFQRWRETFAEKLRGMGVDAEATRQATRGVGRRFEHLWQLKASKAGCLRKSVEVRRSGDAYQRDRIEAFQAWAHIVAALRASDQVSDRELAQQISSFILESDFAKEHGAQQVPPLAKRQRARELEPAVSGTRNRPEIER